MDGWMGACVHVSVCVCVFARARARYTCMYTNMCMHAYKHACMHAYKHVHGARDMHACIQPCAQTPSYWPYPAAHRLPCVCMCVYVCVYVCVQHACMYTNLCTKTKVSAISGSPSPSTLRATFPSKFNPSADFDGSLPRKREYGREGEREDINMYRAFVHA